ncbi:hybrid sensor histidine kinase/response regulator [Actinoplanes ianthinogenes]|uniref:histidine kinase n=1 Tax=Actinoplanes ianthinogenes TaxID=122358 RepID=A0ABM7M6J5_9ACTN|nr:HAMP domain-containing sensor histidine kinase [Actinoplanes ianthinogenes]BCJ47280.1 hybrid sensor histidine kinase/response regulator [Actinoplanes ianthinogenes]GGR42289.1 hybrid sensor histidine kinase/response regulator [Actinoplanes ianthinogenes]
MSRIGLLLPAGRNRDLIEAALRHHDLDVEVVPSAGITDTSVDLLLAEPRSLLEALAAADRPHPDDETGSRPPIMVLTRAGERPVLPARVVDAADEIVTVPVPQRELLDRITSLAGRHQQVCDERRLMREHVAHISHELRTPLQSVLAYAELLADEGLEPEQGTLLDRIANGGQRMLDLVNELLEQSRAEAGHLPDRTTVIDLAEAVRAAIVTIRPLAEKRHLDVCVRTDTDVAPSVRADPVHAHRILINLLSNAVKYNRDHGTIGVVVRVEPIRVEVDITDTGPGIAADELDQIFEPYQRLPGSTATGTGLGLHYARLLAERMQGAIIVSSRPGRGSTFTLALPRAPG